jgi:hypothetical protein
LGVQDVAGSSCGLFVVLPQHFPGGTDKDHENPQSDQSASHPNATGIKLFNNVPPTTKRLNQDIKVFQLALKNYLSTHSYSIDDFTSTEKC